MERVVFQEKGTGQSNKQVKVWRAGSGAVGLPIWAMCEGEQAPEDSLKSEGP